MLHSLLSKSFVGPAPLLEMGAELRRGCVVESYLVIADGEVKVLGGMFRPTGFFSCDFSHQILEEFDAVAPLLFVGVGGAINYVSPFAVLRKHFFLDLLQIFFERHFEDDELQMMRLLIAHVN